MKDDNICHEKPEKPRARIGIPMGLNMYEMLPFWHTLFTRLGFEVVTSPRSDRKLYLKGQQTIPSDTICFPAKLIHGHIEALVDDGVDAIFYPCMTYNFNEKLGDNHYNCPVVAYYPEVIGANVPRVRGVKLIGDYIGIHRPKDFAAKMFEILGFTPEKAQQQFGFLMNAFKYGAPPHGGLAYGLDRWVSLFAGLDSIRDCIAFPKNNSGRDVMLDAPAALDQKQLDELQLALDLKEE